LSTIYFFSLFVYLIISFSVFDDLLIYLIISFSVFDGLLIYLAVTLSFCEYLFIIAFFLFLIHQFACLSLIAQFSFDEYVFSRY
jgi:hypothetical protein